MANIILTNVCNLQCEYCFASSLLKQENKYIQPESFYTILSFLSQSGSHRVGLIGGEPTIHPNFSQILEETNKFCKKTNSTAIIFSNGIFLEPFLDFLGMTDVLINCNSPDSMGKRNYQRLISTLNKAQKLHLLSTDQIRCGCNIHLNQDNYNYFWEIVDTFNLKIVRCSVVAPGGCYQKQWCNQNKKMEYYTKLKPKVMEFVQNAHNRGVKIAFDCNQIPFCFFTKEEKQIIMNTSFELPQSNCTPSIDIDMDLNAFSCFGACGDAISITNFSNVEELERYLFINNTIPKIQHNNGGMCAECDFHKLYKCQGGCLSFANPS